MQNHQDIVLHNLYALYNSIGGNVRDAQFFSGNHFKILNEKSSVWPNIIYDLNSINLSVSVLDEVINKINDYNFEPVLLLEHNTDAINVLKKKGFLFVDRWTGMSINTFNIKKIVIDEAGLACSEIKFEELPGWLRIVSRELFGGMPLSLDIFSYLMSIGCSLISLKRGNKIIGSCMVFYDDTDVAGIYMVCIEKNERSKGYGKYLINYALEVIANSGKNKAVLQSTRMGLPLYKSLGFTSDNIFNLFIKEK